MYNPSNTAISQQSYGILNAIRNESDLFRTSTPVVKDAQSAKAFGEFVTGAGAYKELFWGILINRIGMTLLSGREFKNKLAQFRKGKLALGDVVQNIWIGLVLPEFWASDVNNPGDVYATNKPDAKVSMSAVNVKLSYEVTTNDVELGYAFTQENGLYNLISKITERLLTSEQIDDYLMMKWVIAKDILGNSSAITCMNDELNDQAAADGLTAAMKKVVADYPFMKTQYNEAGVPAPCPIEDTIFISTSKSRANLDVYALSKAFNLQYEAFLGQEVQIYSFGFDDCSLARLYAILDTSYDNDLLSIDPNDIHAYQLESGKYSFRFTDGELEDLEKFTGAVIDRDWFMSFDRVYEMNAIYDVKHLNNNTYLTIHRIYSYNPFANMAMFSEGAKPAISAITGTASVAHGSTTQLGVTATPSPRAGEVTWSSDKESKATVDSTGLVTGVAAGKANITATYKTINGTATKTIEVTVT